MLGRTGDLHVPPADEMPPSVSGEMPEAGGRRSLFDDFETLIDDGRTYFQAELHYQKSRAGFVANRMKLAIAFGVVAAFFAVLATIGLTVGLIIALTPLITAWGATAVVVLAWLLIAYLLVRRASRAWSELSAALSQAPDPDKEATDG